MNLHRFRSTYESGRKQKPSHSNDTDDDDSDAADDSNDNGGNADNNLIAATSNIPIG